jgi:hypothetical protein
VRLCSLLALLPLAALWLLNSRYTGSARCRTRLADSCRRSPTENSARKSYFCRSAIIQMDHECRHRLLEIEALPPYYGDNYGEKPTVALMAAATGPLLTRLQMLLVALLRASLSVAKSENVHQQSKRIGGTRTVILPGILHAIERVIASWVSSDHLLMQSLSFAVTSRGIVGLSRSAIQSPASA